MLDLSRSDFQQSSLIKLDGQWEIKWKQFTDPKEAWEKSPDVYSFPLSWNDLILPDKKTGAHGFASLHLTILLPPGPKQAGLQIRELSSAYTLYINGEKKVSRGTPGIDPGSAIPEVRPALVLFETNSQKLDILIHISNFNHRKGGAWHSIYFGPTNRILQHYNETRFIDIFLLGILFIIFLYHIGLFIIRTEDKSNLVFALYSLDIFIRHGLTTERLLLESLPWLSYTWMLRIEYTTMFLGIPIALHFFHLILKDLLAKYILTFFYTTGALFSAFCFVFPTEIFTHSIPFYQPVLYLGIICGLYIIIRALFEKKPYANLLGLGVIALSVTLINDMLYHREILQTGFYSQYGFFILILTQAFVLSLRFANAFKKTEELSKNLVSLNVAYSRFVPSAFLKQLQKSDIRDIQLGDQVERDMTVLFSDIRSFTKLSEKMTTYENFAFINAYLGKMTPAVSQNRGFIDKYIGDAIMALFPEKSEDAVLSAIQMQKAINDINADRLNQNMGAIEVGIGIHSGNLMLGTIGSKDRMDSTVISDAVNTASRLEELTKKFHSKIIISQTALHRMENYEQYKFRLIGELKLKGKKISTTVYEILDGHPGYQIDLYMESITQFNQAIKYYFKDDFLESKRIFEEVLGINPADKVAQLYIQRCKQKLDL